MVEADLLRVTKIRVDDLFDRYNHEVDLHLDERVTIIHGPNGVGKTVLLRLTADLLSGKLVVNQNSIQYFRSISKRQLIVRRD